MKNRISLKVAMAVIIAAAAMSSCKPKTEVFAIQDNLQPRMMARALFPDAPDSLISALGLEEGIPASVCVYLVRKDGKNLLFDAGNGTADSQLLPAMEKAGVSPSEIDGIFITHLHGDHTGGMLKDGEPVFANAKVYLNKEEYDGWGENARNNEVLKAYSDRLVIFDADEELPYGIKAVKAYGHTPGHTMYRFDNVLIAGDIMHGVALQLDHPEVCAGFDMNKDKARESRRMCIRIAEEEGLRVYGMHFPEPFYIQF